MRIKIMSDAFDRTKSLQEIENVDWGEPEFHSSVIINCHRLRRIPIANFQIEDLRLMIGQNIGIEYLVPVAIEHLEKNPLASGDLFDGDLLHTIVKLDASFWEMNPIVRNKLRQIIVSANEKLSQVDETTAETICEITRSFSI